MTDMIAFSQAMLAAIATFLLSPPIFYIVSLVCLCVVVKVFKMIITP